MALIVEGDRLALDLNLVFVEEWNRKVRAQRVFYDYYYHYYYYLYEHVIPEEDLGFWKQWLFEWEEEVWRRRRRAEKLAGRRARIGSWRQRRGEKRGGGR